MSRISSEHFIQRFLDLFLSFLGYYIWWWNRRRCHQEYICWWNMQRFVEGLYMITWSAFLFLGFTSQSGQPACHFQPGVHKSLRRERCQGEWQFGKGPWTELWCANSWYYLINMELAFVFSNMVSTSQEASWGGQVRGESIGNFALDAILGSQRNPSIF